MASRRAVFFIVLACLTGPARAVAPTYQCLRSFYVSTQGSDSNPGTSTGQAFLTIQHAASSSLRAGDCVVVLPGTYDTFYTPTGGSGDSATGYVVFKSQTPQGAKIVGNSSLSYAVALGVNYVILDGFDVSGSGAYGVSSISTHHIQVLNCVVHDNTGGGIGLTWGDHYLIQGNITHDNASGDPAQDSGISVWEARAISDAAAGFHIQILQNISYGNIEGNISGIQNMHTDGDGIIVDSFHNQQGSDPTWTNVNFPYPTLVENNLVFNNGARGIIVYESDHVTVRNNTAFHNNVDRQNLGDTRGELSNSDSSDNTWENNIGYVDTSVLATLTAIEDISAIGPNAGVKWLHNLTFNGTAGQAALILQNTSSTVTAADGNQLGVNPEVVKAAIDSTEDFHLKAGSPAAGAGTSDHAAVDLVNAPRAPGPADLGAYALPIVGAPDAGTPDAGSSDAGSPDAGSPDAGVLDAGMPDSGPGGPGASAQDGDAGSASPPSDGLGVPAAVRGGWGCRQSGSSGALWPLLALLATAGVMRRRSRSAP